MNADAQIVHLLLERVGPGSDKERTAPRSAEEAISIDPLVIRSGVNYLLQERGKRPRLLSRAPKKKEGLFALQQVTRNGTPCLVLLSPAEVRPVINGRIAPTVSLLSERDEVLFDKHGEFLVHVTVFNQMHIGPPPEDEVGRDCRFCRTPFFAGSRVYLCLQCGKALHLEADDKPEEERLQCAHLCSVCPTCEAPILKTNGYRSLPEFCKPLTDRGLT